MKAYALDYEFGEARQIALKLPECLFRGTPDAASAPKHEAEIVPFPEPVPPQPQPTASVSFMITKAQEAELLSRGYTDAQIRMMTPTEAHRILGTAPVTIKPARFGESLKAVGQLVLDHQIELRNIASQDVRDMRNGLYGKRKHVLGPLVKNPYARYARDFERTDLGNAEYFVELYGHIFRFDRIHKRWLEWRNHRWEPNGRAAEAAQQAAGRRLVEAASTPQPTGKPDDDAFKAALMARDSAVKWAMNSERRYAIDSVLALADDMTAIVVHVHA